VKYPPARLGYVPRHIIRHRSPPLASTLTLHRQPTARQIM